MHVQWECSRICGPSKYMGGFDLGVNVDVPVALGIYTGLHEELGTESDRRGTGNTIVSCEG